MHAKTLNYRKESKQKRETEIGKKRKVWGFVFLRAIVQEAVLPNLFHNYSFWGFRYKEIEIIDFFICSKTRKLRLNIQSNES